MEEYNIELDTEGLAEKEKNSIDAATQYEQFQNNYRTGQEQVAEQKREEQVTDPKNPERRGFFGELSAAVKGGVQDTASSIVTFPERLIDMTTGEMVEEGKTEEGYGAEWDDWFVDDANPIETRTWWGGAIRSLVHFGTMAAAIIPAAKVMGVTAATTVVGSLVRGAAIGGVSDVVSKYSQEDNGLGILRDHYGFIDTPISTKDTDHPAMKTLKNVVEGMGIGIVFDSASILISKGVKKIRPNKQGKNVIVDGAQEQLDKALLREQNVNDQILEKAIDDIKYKGNEYTPYKNKPVSSSYQAAPTSTGKASDVNRQLDRIDKEWGAENGSTDSLHTPVQIERTGRSAAMADKETARVLEDFMSEPRIKQEIAKAQANKQTLSEVWERAAKNARKLFEGRNTTEISDEDFWAPLMEGKARFNEGSADEFVIMNPANVAAADLVIGSLLREIRDTGITGRELYDIANLSKAEGPVKAMYDKVIAGLTQIKLTKMQMSGKFAELGAGKGRRVTKQMVYEAVDAQVDQSMEAFQLALKFAGNNKDDSLFKAIWETISMSNDLHNLTDIDAWMRKKLLGGELNGKKQIGVLVKELQGVMINSVLSGPKTPMRAILGTGSATFLRPFAQYIGATLSGDALTRRSSLAALSGMLESIPEAFKLFKTKLNAYWSGEISTVKSRYSSFSKGDEQWDMYQHWLETSEGVTDADKAAFYLANMSRSWNDNKFLTYSTKVMAATDDTFGFILARSRAKEKAMREAMGLFNKGRITEITPELLSNAQDRFLKEIVDQDGNITDAATLFAKKEVTLTQDLQGFSKALESAFDAAPWAKPFFLFARTGVNGLSLAAKHTPGFNFLVDEWNDIFFAKPTDLRKVKKYGIETAEDLANAKALQNGRLAMGASVIFMANQMFMSGNLTGNGPANRQQRKAWIDGGYKPRTITLGGVQVGYDALEPFNIILSTIADIGDHNQLMGQEWTEQNLLKVSLVVAQGISSKSYLAGMQQFVDLLSGQEGSFERIIAGLMNNQIPMSSLRNELGKLFNPHMKELNAGIWQSIRNRNQFMESLPGSDLPVKYDLLNGQPIKDWNFMTRMFNMFSPVSFNLDQGAGRKLLFDSGFDMRMSVLSSPDSLDLSNNPLLRSLFQKAIGEQNLEDELNRLAADPKIKASLARMEWDLNNGARGNDPMQSYYHNRVIYKLFQSARKRAWAQISNHPEAVQLYNQQKYIKLRSNSSLYNTRSYNPQAGDQTTPIGLVSY